MEHSFHLSVVTPQQKDGAKRWVLPFVSKVIAGIAAIQSSMCRQFPPNALISQKKSEGNEVASKGTRHESVVYVSKARLTMLRLPMSCKRCTHRCCIPLWTVLGEGVEGMGGDVSEYANFHPLAHQVRRHHQENVECFKNRVHIFARSYVARHSAELPMEQRISFECLDYNCVWVTTPLLRTSTVWLLTTFTRAGQVVFILSDRS